ncbi:hypothetical protein [Paraglaciecola hydrolytica]|uniref:Uncharacterized protein n=1 Tax=Paraglaciecola hydrolytica TaxID=1799789 RepID=A0A135ZZG8_9ALTE|nr:hypothetical protein [Paraglaciecola hydrolytica]KXI28381.1 hypothetical protein AX660_18645 [Paraglaciecola hydrolytica]
MKINNRRLTETVLDRSCGVCNQSLIIDLNGIKFEEYGELRADWGYGSKQNGKCYQIDLCESCFTQALFVLRDARRAHVMFDH